MKHSIANMTKCVAGLFLLILGPVFVHLAHTSIPSGLAHHNFTIFHISSKLFYPLGTQNNALFTLHRHPYNKLVYLHTHS